MSAISVEKKWPALFSRYSRSLLNPHEFHVVTDHRITEFYASSQAAAAASAASAAAKRIVKDVWEEDGVRRSSRVRMYERDASSRPPPVAVENRVNATLQKNVLGHYDVHPVIELDFVGPPALHRYPHLRKFCSMVEFDLLSPQRVAAFWCTARLFPDTISEIFCFELRARSMLGAVRYNEHFEWPSLPELLEMCEVYREYFRPTSAIARELVAQNKALFDSAQKLTGRVFQCEKLNESFRVLVFLAFVVRPLCVGRRTTLMRRLFDYVYETRTSYRRSNRALLAILEALPIALEARQISSLLVEFRLPSRKYNLLYPEKLDKHSLD